MLYRSPEQWISLFDGRIKNVHLKELSNRVHEYGIDTLRPPLDATTSWPAVLEAFISVCYRGNVTFECFHPLPHWPNSLISRTSDAILRRKGAA